MGDGKILNFPGAPNTGMPRPPKPQVTVDMVRNSKTIQCECGSVLFRHALAFKRLSHIITGSGQDEVMPVEVFVCDKCGKPSKELMHADVIKELDEPRG